MIQPAESPRPQADPWPDPSTTGTPAEAAPAEAAGPFEPHRYLTQISGRDYLEVRWRLLWLRSEHPDAVIETDCKRDDGKQAVFFSRVTLPSGASATGWGQETKADFGDYLEKAETKSLGRALAALGFGTQFATDLDDGAPSRPVDAPVDWRAGGNQGGATGAQLRAIQAVARAARLSDAQVAVLAQQQHGVHPDQLDKRQAAAFIDLLKARLAGDTPAEPNAPTPIRTTAPGASSVPAPVAPLAPTDTRPTQEQRDRLRVAGEKSDWSTADITQAMKDLWRKQRSSELTSEQMERLIDLLEGRLEYVAGPDGFRLEPASQALWDAIPEA